MYRLLVVDDEEKIRVLIRKYAEFEGYEVEEAADGMSAIELCRQNKFDLIILDVMMPELDGFSACREIRKFSQVPVLMISARGEEYDRIHGFELGVDDYVTKPFSPKELMMRVQAILPEDLSMSMAKRSIFPRRSMSFCSTWCATEASPSPIAHQRRLGLRLFGDDRTGYPYQTFKKGTGKIQQLHCNAQRCRLSL